MQFASFWNGVMRPSALSTLTALITLITICVAGISLKQSGLDEHYAGFLARSPRDHHLFVTSQLEQLASQSDERPLIAIVGASVTLSSFGQTKQVADEVFSATGQDVQVVALATGRQNILEHLMIIDNLPANRPVTVVLGVGPSRLTWTKEDMQEAIAFDNFGVSSPNFDLVAQRIGLELPLRTGITALDHSKFYLARLQHLLENLLGRLTRGPIARSETQWLDRKMPDNERHERSKRVMARFENFDEKVPLNLDLLQDLITLAKERDNINLVLVEHAISPQFLDEYFGQEEYQDYLELMETVSERNSIPYWKLALDARLSNKSFYDWAHINDAGTQDLLRASLIQRTVRMNYE